MNIEEQIRLLARAVIELQETRCDHASYCSVDIPQEMIETPEETEERKDREFEQQEAERRRWEKDEAARLERMSIASAGLRAERAMEGRRALNAQDINAQNARRNGQVYRAQLKRNPKSPRTVTGFDYIATENDE